MPIYEYKSVNGKGCDYCKPGFEYLHLSRNEDLLDKCPECGSKLEKIISKSSFELKGSGWTKPAVNEPKEDSAEKTSTNSCNSCSATSCDGCKK